MPRDLFQSDDGGWLQDAALLHKLLPDAFRHHSGGGCLEASVRPVFVPVRDDVALPALLTEDEEDVQHATAAE